MLTYSSKIETFQKRLYLTKSIKKLEIENQEFHYIYKTKDKIEQLLIENRDDKIGWETEIIFDIK